MSTGRRSNLSGSSTFKPVSGFTPSGKESGPTHEGVAVGSDVGKGVIVSVGGREVGDGTDVSDSSTLRLVVHVGGIRTVGFSSSISTGPDIVLPGLQEKSRKTMSKVREKPLAEHFNIDTFIDPNDYQVLSTVSV